MNLRCSHFGLHVDMEWLVVTEELFQDFYNQGPACNWVEFVWTSLQGTIGVLIPPCDEGCGFISDPRWGGEE